MERGRHHQGGSYRSSTGWTAACTRDALLLYGKLTDADARVLASYLRSIKPVQNQLPGPIGPSKKPTAAYLTIVMPQ